MMRWIVDSLSVITFSHCSRELHERDFPVTVVIDRIKENKRRVANWDQMPRHKVNSRLQERTPPKERRLKLLEAERDKHIKELGKWDEYRE